MATVQELITQANYYLNQHNTGNLAQDNATDTKGKQMLQEAVKRLENGEYQIVKLMTDDDLSVGGKLTYLETDVDIFESLYGNEDDYNE